MKVAKIILALSVVWSGFGFAELYAERGTVAGGMPLAELDPDVRVPEALEVPIPLLQVLSLSVEVEISIASWD